MKRRPLTYIELMRAEVEMVKASKENKRRLFQGQEVPREGNAADRPSVSVVGAEG